jgi:hypothetical protein
VASPNGASGSVLNGVSCTSASNCFAVGASILPSQTVLSYSSTLVEKWDGATWSIVSSPTGSGAENNLLRVACPSATMCVAVGNSFSTGSPPILLQWNGASWTNVNAPKRAGATGGGFYGVSCPNTATCFAAGNSWTPDGTFNLIDQYA